jgi:hypothetical protein
MTNKQSQQQYEIGMIGLGVIGCNLLLKHGRPWLPGGGR